MFRSKKFRLVAASLLCLLLLGTNAGASQSRDESIAEAAELNNEAVVCVKDHQYEQAVELLKKRLRFGLTFPPATTISVASIR
jgi:hypothetical protein